MAVITRTQRNKSNLLPVGAEGSAGLPNLPNLPFSEFGSQSNTNSSLPSLPFSELAPIKHALGVIVCLESLANRI